MPIYEYACRNCDHTLDALQKMSENPLVDCPACGEPQLKRLISAPRFRLKGQGWYETDFKKDNQRNLSSGDGEQASTDKGSSESAGGKEKKDSSKEAGTSKSETSKTAGSSDSG